MASRALWVIGAELMLSAGLAALALVGGSEGRARALGDGASNGWVFGSRPVEGFAEGRCRYDLSQGPVRVTAELWRGALSVAIQGADGGVVFAADDRSAPQGVDVVLAAKGQAAPRGAKVVISPSPTGTVLQRRPAPTPERFAEADTARRGDSCAPAGLDFPAAPRR